MDFKLTDIIDNIDDSVDQKKVIKIMTSGIEHNWDAFTIIMLLYREVYGRTLCKKFCELMVDKMHNAKGEHGKKWTVEHTNELAKKNGIDFGSDYTEYEFNCVVHMMYYDYAADIKDSGISSDSIYAKMADSYLTDIDAPKGRLVNYFFFVMRDE